MAVRPLLDEYAAWCELAMLCDRVNLAERTSGIGYWSTASRRNLLGICDGIHWIAPRYIQWRMRDRAFDHRPGYRGGYWWKHTHRGWQHRQDFCWRMAELCAIELEAA